MERLFAHVFEQYNLLQHPFYLAWNEGHLTKEQMAVYAGEYGSFIQLISEGWHAAGEQAIAQGRRRTLCIMEKLFGKPGHKKYGSYHKPSQ